MTTAIYIVAALMIGVIIGIIIELISEKPYIEELERMLEVRHDVDIIELDDEYLTGYAEISDIEEMEDDLFKPF